MPKALLDRRVDVLKRDFGFGANDGGLYCLTPYPLNSDGMGLFKVGMTTSFKRRMDSYNQVVPNGVWFVAFYRPSFRGIRDDAVVGGRTRSQAKQKSTYERKRDYIAGLERQLLRTLRAVPGVVNYQTYVNAGRSSEWFFCRVDDIHRAFSQMDRDQSRVRLIDLKPSDADDWNDRERRLFRRLLDVRQVIGVWKAGTPYPSEPTIQTRAQARKRPRFT
jgi:hypothetical protein